MDGIEADIVIYSQDVAAKEVNKYLSQVTELIQVNRNFFKEFVQIECTIQTWQGEHGNTCSEEETKHAPLPEWQRDSVNDNIQFELHYYGVTLNKLSGYLSGGLLGKEKEKFYW